MSHTPGPWTIKTWPNEIHIRGEYRQEPVLVAIVERNFHPNMTDNARFIAKAPELLAILKTLCIETDENIDIEQRLNTVAAAREIIREATGGEPCT